MSTAKDEIRDLLEPGTLDQADASLARLQTLLDGAQAEASELHAAADALLVDEPAESERLEAEAKDADRKARRCVLAIERVTERRTELQQAETEAQKRDLQRKAKQLAAKHLKQHEAIDKQLVELADNTDDYAHTRAELEAINDQLQALGAEVEHVPAYAALFRPEEYETRIIESEERDVSLQGNDERQVGKIMSAGKPFVRTRRERVRVDPGRVVPDYSRCKMLLPHPEDARAWLIRRDG